MGPRNKNTIVEGSNSTQETSPTLPKINSSKQESSKSPALPKANVQESLENRNTSALNVVEPDSWYLSIKKRLISAVQGIPKIIESALDLVVGAAVSIAEYAVAGVLYLSSPLHNQDPNTILGKFSSEVIEFNRNLFNNLKASSFNNQFETTFGFRFFTGSIFGTSQEFAQMEISLQNMMRLNTLGHLSDSTIGVLFDSIDLSINHREMAVYNAKYNKNVNYVEFLKLQESDSELLQRRQYYIGAELVGSTLLLVASGGGSGSTALQRISKLANYTKVLKVPVLMASASALTQELSAYDKEKGIASLSLQRSLVSLLSGTANNTVFIGGLNLSTNLYVGLRSGIWFGAREGALANALSSAINVETKMSQYAKFTEALKKSDKFSHIIDIVDGFGDLGGSFAGLDAVWDIKKSFKYNLINVLSNPVNSLGRAGSVIIAAWDVKDFRGGAADVKSQVEENNPVLKLPKSPKFVKSDTLSEEGYATFNPQSGEITLPTLKAILEHPDFQEYSPRVQGLILNILATHETIHWRQVKDGNYHYQDSRANEIAAWEKTALHAREMGIYLDFGKGKLRFLSENDQLATARIIRQVRKESFTPTTIDLPDITQISSFVQNNYAQQESLAAARPGNFKISDDDLRNYAKGDDSQQAAIEVGYLETMVSTLDREDEKFFQLWAEIEAKLTSADQQVRKGMMLFLLCNQESFITPGLRILKRLLQQGDNISLAAFIFYAFYLQDELKNPRYQSSHDFIKELKTLIKENPIHLINFEKICISVNDFKSQHLSLGSLSNNQGEDALEYFKNELGENIYGRYRQQGIILLKQKRNKTRIQELLGSGNVQDITESIKIASAIYEELLYSKMALTPASSDKDGAMITPKKKEISQKIIVEEDIAIEALRVFALMLNQGNYLLAARIFYTFQLDLKIFTDARMQKAFLSIIADNLKNKGHKIVRTIALILGQSGTNYLQKYLANIFINPSAQAYLITLIEEDKKCQEHLIAAYEEADVAQKISFPFVLFDEQVLRNEALVQAGGDTIVALCKNTKENLAEIIKFFESLDKNGLEGLLSDVFLYEDSNGVHVVQCFSERLFLGLHNEKEALQVIRLLAKTSLQKYLFGLKHSAEEAIKELSEINPVFKENIKNLALHFLLKGDEKSCLFVANLLGVDFHAKVLFSINTAKRFFAKCQELAEQGKPTKETKDKDSFKRNVKLNEMNISEILNKDSDSQLFYAVCLQSYPNFRKVIQANNLVSKNWRKEISVGKILEHYQEYTDVWLFAAAVNDQQRGIEPVKFKARIINETGGNERHSEQENVIHLSSLEYLRERYVQCRIRYLIENEIKSENKKTWEAQEEERIKVSKEAEAIARVEAEGVFAYFDPFSDSLVVMEQEFISGEYLEDQRHLIKAIQVVHERVHRLFQRKRKKGRDKETSKENFDKKEEVEAWVSAVIYAKSHGIEINFKDGTNGIEINFKDRTISYDVIGDRETRAARIFSEIAAKKKLAEAGLVIKLPILNIEQGKLEEIQKYVDSLYQGRRMLAIAGNPDIDSNPENENESVIQLREITENKLIKLFSRGPKSIREACDILKNLMQETKRDHQQEVVFVFSDNLLASAMTAFCEVLLSDLYLAAEIFYALGLNYAFCNGSIQFRQFRKFLLSQLDENKFEEAINNLWRVMNDPDLVNKIFVDWEIAAEEEAVIAVNSEVSEMVFGDYEIQDPLIASYIRGVEKGKFIIPLRLIDQNYFDENQFLKPLQDAVLKSADMNRNVTELIDQLVYYIKSGEVELVKKIFSIKEIIFAINWRLANALTGKEAEFAKVVEFAALLLSNQDQRNPCALALSEIDLILNIQELAGFDAYLLDYEKIAKKLLFQGKLSECRSLLLRVWFELLEVVDSICDDVTFFTIAHANGNIDSAIRHLDKYCENEKKRNSWIMICFQSLDSYRRIIINKKIHTLAQLVEDIKKSSEEWMNAAKECHSLEDPFNFFRSVSSVFYQGKETKLINSYSNHVLQVGSYELLQDAYVTVRLKVLLAEPNNENKEFSLLLAQAREEAEKIDAFYDPFERKIVLPAITAMSSRPKRIHRLMRALFAVHERAHDQVELKRKQGVEISYQEEEILAWEKVARQAAFYGIKIDFRKFPATYKEVETATDSIEQIRRSKEKTGINLKPRIRPATRRTIAAFVGRNYDFSTRSIASVGGPTEDMSNLAPTNTLQAIKQEILRQLAAGKELIVEIGCGDGSSASEIAKRNPNAVVVGIDPLRETATFVGAAINESNCFLLPTTSENLLSFFITKYPFLAGRVNSLQVYFPYPPDTIASDKRWYLIQAIEDAQVLLTKVNNSDSNYSSNLTIVTDLGEQLINELEKIGGIMAETIGSQMKLLYETLASLGYDCRIHKFDPRQESGEHSQFQFLGSSYTFNQIQASDADCDLVVDLVYGAETPLNRIDRETFRYYLRNSRHHIFCIEAQRRRIVDGTSADQTPERRRLQIENGLSHNYWSTVSSFITPYQLEVHKNREQGERASRIIAARNILIWLGENPIGTYQETQKEAYELSDKEKVGKIDGMVLEINTLVAVVNETTEEREVVEIWNKIIGICVEIQKIIQERAGIAAFLIPEFANSSSNLSVVKDSAVIGTVDDSRIETNREQEELLRVLILDWLETQIEVVGREAVEAFQQSFQNSTEVFQLLCNLSKEEKLTCLNHANLVRVFVEHVSKPNSPIEERFQETIFRIGSENFNQIPLCAGRYRYVSYLGKGIEGVVFRVLDQQDNKIKALKFYYRNTKREADIWKEVLAGRERIVRIEDVGTTTKSGNLFVVTELIDAPILIHRHNLEQAASFVPPFELLRCYLIWLEEVHLLYEQGIIVSDSQFFIYRDTNGDYQIKLFDQGFWVYISSDPRKNIIFNNADAPGFSDDATFVRQFSKIFESSWHRLKYDELKEEEIKQLLLKIDKLHSSKIHEKIFNFNRYLALVKLLLNKLLLQERLTAVEVQEFQEFNLPLALRTIEVIDQNAPIGELTGSILATEELAMKKEAAKDTSNAELGQPKSLLELRKAVPVEYLEAISNVEFYRVPDATWSEAFFFKAFKLFSIERHNSKERNNPLKELGIIISQSLQDRGIFFNIPCGADKRFSPVAIEDFIWTLGASELVEVDIEAGILGMRIDHEIPVLANGQYNLQDKLPASGQRQVDNLVVSTYQDDALAFLSRVQRMPDLPMVFYLAGLDSALDTDTGFNIDYARYLATEFERVCKSGDLVILFSVSLLGLREKNETFVEMLIKRDFELIYSQILKLFCLRKK